MDVITNLQALSGIVGDNYPFSDSAYLKVLIDEGLLSTDNYASVNEKGIDYAAMAFIFAIILRPNIEEGGYKVSDADKKSFIITLNMLRGKYGLPPADIYKPNITKVTPW